MKPTLYYIIVQLIVKSMKFDRCSCKKNTFIYLFTQWRSNLDLGNIYISMAVCAKLLGWQQNDY